MKKRIIVSVTNDIATDQRVYKVCSTLHNMGFEVILRGRLLVDSLPIQRPYKVIRIKHLFNHSALFYAEFNIRLFFYLLFNRADVLVANDLDTLFANQLAASIKGIPVVFDSHEYFTEVPEIQNRLIVKKVWQGIEKIFLPKAYAVYTVNESIANLFREKYQREILVVKNVPLKSVPIERKSRALLGLPENVKILILQGSGINVDRGGEELVEAMQFVDDALLLIIGSGDVLPWLKQRVQELKLEDKVQFIPKMPYRDMMLYTANADLGFTLDKNTNINYRYSLPNKIFDYLSAGLPVFATDLIEVRKVIEKYKVGVICKDMSVKNMSELINTTLRNEEQLSEMKRNTQKAREELNWEKEEIILKKIYTPFV